jgi:hypothetical protein
MVRDVLCARFRQRPSAAIRARPNENQALQGVGRHVASIYGRNSVALCSSLAENSNRKCVA